MNPKFTNSKIAIAFIGGILVSMLFQASPSKASNTAISGSFICVGSFSGWGWRSNNGDEKEYNEISYIDFTSRTYSVIVNKASINSDAAPKYSEGAVESGAFAITTGPIPGTFKLMFDNEYVIIAPVNSGNSIFVIDSQTGMTGTCQKI